mmetsp:Transcript_91987/g.297586  ORF Transcript_91987/g.297586 Transcript_91987/m.297586 type:complete len:473 (-) Transcript_91987:87-1505(-)
MVQRHEVLAMLVWSAAAAPWIFCLGSVDEYMDEIFHAPQTRKYCEGRFSEWDPKITTFPGLYVFGAALPNLLGALSPGSGAATLLCSLSFLRAVNVIFGIGSLLVMHLLLKRRMSNGKAAAQALVLSMYPIHFFYTFLYYTDVGSLFWVLLTHHLATPLPSRGLPSRARIFCASLAGLVAVAFRQTNAVWVMFTFGTAALADVSASDKWAPRLSGSEGGDVGLSIGIIATFIWALICELPRLLSRLGTLLLPPALFVAFVVVNGAVVVGDHSNHQAVIHWAQLAYLVAVTTSMWGVFGPQAGISIGNVKAFGAACFGGLKALAITVLALCGLVYALHRYSFAHPFLLADNRHYTFYVWSRFLGRLPGLKEALAPVYLYSAWLCYRRLAGSQSPLWFLIWAIACVLTLVPAHLLEPRYWTTAVILAHVNGPEQTWLGLASVGIACLLVNLATLWIFCFKPFAWPGGEMARFMW